MVVNGLPIAQPLSAFLESHDSVLQETPLHAAIRRKSLPMLKMLVGCIQRNLQVVESSPTLGSSSVSIVQFLQVCNARGQTPLSAAMESRQEEMVQLLETLLQQEEV